jgi:hypothetical protein
MFAIIDEFEVAIPQLETQWYLKMAKRLQCQKQVQESSKRHTVFV